MDTAVSDFSIVFLPVRRVEFAPAAYAPRERDMRVQRKPESW
jgi:hypothetical protein